MKLAIHKTKGSFSDRWIEYCEQNNISFKIVNCYNSNILEQLKGCFALMWHYYHGNYKDVLCAKPLLFSLEQAGIKVFPDFNTAWHFDDKVGQKYLLEAIDAPLVPTHVFYDKKTAKEWAENTTYPKVFKLRGGAGAANVSLVRSAKEVQRKINIAFGKGFSQFNGWGNLKDRYQNYKNKKETLFGLIKGIGRLFIPTEFSKISGREKGYVYFQEFIPNNTFDIRVIVIGERAFAIKRLVREGDFRASGSGNIVHDNEQIDLRCVKMAFDVNKTIKAQSIGYDFVFDKENNPLIIEFSYGFGISGNDACPGYWDNNLNWHLGKFNPQHWMVEDILKSSA